MRYTRLGNTGIEVSTLCFGTMTFGRESDRDVARQVFDRTVEAGINFFDCANVYAGGESERLLGEFVGERRDDFVLTSKCGFGFGERSRNRAGLSRRNIHEAVEGSLRRMGTDYLDVYFAHCFDGNVPLEEFLRAMDDLVSAGKVRHFGVSNWAAWQIAKGLGVSDGRGWNKIAVIQPMYNLVKRQAEVEILPLAVAENLGVINYSPLGGGLLTGKHTFTERPENSRMRDNEMYQRRYGQSWMFETAAALKALAAERGVSPVTLAVAWAERHPGITAPIIGARNLEQLEPALAAGELEMDDALYAELSALSPAPPPAHDRTE